jgi:hypothetical protein
MQACWRWTDTERPSFGELESLFSDILMQGKFSNTDSAGGCEDSDEQAVVTVGTRVLEDSAV